ncbi:MAG: hypothetical protein GYB35_13100 [Algicola sp.]|nr:hypothetical protein [Algicola sp.]
METPIRNKVYITNFVFLFGITLLFLNDQFFKFKFSNFLTGKISDICGVIIFPMLLAYIFPKLKEYSIVLSSLVFIFWKSEYSQGLIEFYNSISPIETSRVIDYTDLLALLFIPIPYYLIKNPKILSSFSFKKLNEKIILIPVFLILISESPPTSYYYTYSDGNLICNKCTTTVNYSTNDLIVKLKDNGIIFDSIKPIYVRGVVDSTSYLCLKKELIIDKDTLRDIYITLRSSNENKTIIYFNGMNVPKDLTNKKLKRKLRKYYSKLIATELKKRL